MDKKKEIKDHYMILTTQIIEKMKESLEYKTPWMICKEPPYNPVTKTHYKGINLISLRHTNFNDSRFFTFKNLQDLSKETGSPILIKKGEHGHPLFKAFQRTIFKNKKEETTEEGKEATAKFWAYTYAGTVFNATQIEGLPPDPQTENKQINSIEEIDKILKALSETNGLKLQHQDIKNPFYSPSDDTIFMPLKEKFNSTEGYYMVLLNMIVKATSHEKRMNRIPGDKDEKKESFENLVGELGAYFLGAKLNLPYQAEIDNNQIAYLNSWIKNMEQDKGMIFKASSKANQASEYLLKIKKEYFNEPDDPSISEVTEKPAKKMKI
jgi:antirestriction protein ArdC